MLARTTIREQEVGALLVSRFGGTIRHPRMRRLQTDWNWATIARRKVMGKPHARAGPPPPVDHGVSSVVHSATKVAHRLIRLICHLFGMLRPSRREVIAWRSRPSFRGDGSSARASFISRRFINSACKMGLKIGDRASRCVGSMPARRELFLWRRSAFITGLVNLTIRSADRRVPTHGLMRNECLLAWRLVNIVSPKLVGCRSSLLQLRHNHVVGLASARR
jgi:hypothetical protein